jgi:H+/Cl- antiporter ClcA
MKRTLTAPLLSALMPGVGQIINRQFPKAGLFIAGFSILFMALVFKVLYDLNQVMMSLNWELLEKDSHRLQTITQALGQRSKTVLLILLILLVGFWAYNVWDAFSQARKSERVGHAPSSAG